MKKHFLLLICLLACLVARAAAPETPTPEQSARRKFVIDSLQNKLHYQLGRIKLPGGVGELEVPDGFRYLDSTQSRHVLTEWWGNPTGESLGMLLPMTKGPLDEQNWAFVIEYKPMGYVKDTDADEINYDDLLKEMQDDMVEANEERTSAGYETVQLIGWAAKPYYDKDKKALHWAKELQFGEGSERTLNYNLRLLGRKGVLILNAVGTPDQVAEIQQQIPAVIDGVAFAKGLRYADFNPGIDEVAAYTIGGLVAGKVLAKVGFFAIILKFGKVILLMLLKFWQVLLGLLAAGVSAIRKFFGGKASSTEQLALETESTNETEKQV
ncbi:DUF2167 domain-containing protein [Hymenobacter sp. GOD-10R]|uniref:DUF2167 domain-containing protein n=1 Tax=Hymenobacter sp. GOD-10R TaxID=3093922 RepID=UPI002D76D780|nr:DUF2167 domain-containing protein [Hymenobacter sp. GOD-10R]WRQ29621.1 DUF2167 domain-containing protein [Hymenobacter sp. GOD-10R]